MRHAYANANGDCNGYAHTDSYTYCDSNGHAYADSYTYSDSCLTHSDTDVCGRQSIHDKPDRRQHRAGHHRHRQSRG